MSSAFIPDWRGLQPLGSDWRELSVFKLPDYQTLSRLAVDYTLTNFLPPPGYRRFVANKRRTAIRSIDDRSVEAIFPPVFGVVLTGLLTAKFSKTLTYSHPEALAGM